MDPKQHGGDDEVELYGDPLIASKNAPVPRWLFWSYFGWIAFGLVWFYLYWNGSYGWLDRGYWQQLQRAAATTYPFQVDLDDPPPSHDISKKDRLEIDKE